MSKRILVKTDDPDKKKVYLVVTGSVEKKAKVDPQSLYLDGKAGDTIEASIKITPSQNNLFSTLNIEQKPDSALMATVMAPEKKEDPWLVALKVTSEKVEHIFETLILKTDNPREPDIKIKVSANFTKGI